MVPQCKRWCTWPLRASTSCRALSSSKQIKSIDHVRAQGAYPLREVSGRLLSMAIQPHMLHRRPRRVVAIRLALAPADRENLVATVHQAGHKVGAHVPRATDDDDPQHLSVRSSSEDNRSENTVHPSGESEARHYFRRT